MNQRGSSTFAHRSLLLELLRAPWIPVRDYFRKYRHRPLVRPWALSAPILVLVLALPMLRPLRHPADVSDDEALRLATITALVQHRTLALEVPPIVEPQLAAQQLGTESGSDPSDLTDLDRLIQVHGRSYSAQPPVMAVLLSFPAWVMSKMGLGPQENLSLVAYVLT